MRWYFTAQVLQLKSPLKFSAPGLACLMKFLLIALFMHDAWFTSITDFADIAAPRCGKLKVLQAHQSFDQREEVRGYSVQTLL